MITLSMEEFRDRVLSKSWQEMLKEEDGFAIHCRHLYDHNNSKSLFYLTGIDFSDMFAGRKDTSGVQLLTGP